jgi:NDP-sugar pyrophosphorylase family protein
MDPNNQFHFTNFFKELGIFRHLFETSDYPWNVLKNLDDFIKNFKNTPFISGFDEISENIFVGKNVDIDSDAKIVGGAIICDNVTIGHSAYLRGGVLLGERVHIGHATEVKHSVVLSGSKLAHLNYIGDSIIGSDVNVSGSATLANFRFDKKEVEIKTENEKITTGMIKFGSIVGDDSFLGVNAVLNPGTILGKKTLVFPLISVKGVHQDGETIK